MKEKLGALISINDLKDLEYKETGLSPQQRLAIKNFDRYRYRMLTSVASEAQFHEEFQRLQVMSNLSSYEEFLKDEYC
ncbi:MAG: hypothetical protein RIC15_01960 [Vicingaceae bacterium]